MLVLRLQQLLHFQVRSPFCHVEIRVFDFQGKDTSLIGRYNDGDLVKLSG